ncbi:unnamed protein product [Closterium sp. Naga37s-1]|nr:unnamed protein product [Closterium sp. Naga37s-1]
MVSPARTEPPFSLERLPDDVLALVLRSLAQTSFRHALVSKRWLRLSTAALSHLTVQHRGFKTFLLEIHNPEHFRNAQLAWLPLPHLLSALHRFPALTHVSLGQFSILSADGDALFKCLAATCPRLLHLTVEHQFEMSVTVDGLASLFRGCRKLRDLRLLTTNGLPHLPASLSLLTDLQTLHVCSNIHHGEDSLQELVSPPESIGALQQLRELRISAGANFRGLDGCVGLLSNLRTLSIKSTPNITEQHPGLVSLTELKVSYCPLISSLPENFSFPALHTLTLYSLGNLENLLDLSGKQLPKLQHLDLEGVGADSALSPVDCIPGVRKGRMWLLLHAKPLFLLLKLLDLVLQLVLLWIVNGCWVLQGVCTWSAGLARRSCRFASGEVEESNPLVTGCLHVVGGSCTTIFEPSQKSAAAGAVVDIEWLFSAAGGLQVVGWPCSAIVQGSIQEVATLLLRRVTRYDAGGGFTAAAAAGIAVDMEGLFSASA